MEKVQQLTDIIKTLRTNNKISMQNLINSIGCKSSAAYCYKETGKSPFYLDELIKICDLLDITLTISYTLNNEVIKIKNDIEDITSMIINLRENKGFSKDNFRFQLGMSLPNYLNKEKGKKSFTLNEFIKICELLDISCKINYVGYSKDIEGKTFRSEKEYIIN